jgi:uncharacterized protein involved in exopolysaccharide biosynthesis
MSTAAEPGTPEYYDDEIDLFELAANLWEDKVLIAGITALAAVFSVVFALLQPNMFEAKALLQPKASQGGGASSLARQYGGLASLAGISLPSGSGESKTQLALEVLKSKRFAYDFAERHELLPALFALKDVDSAGEVVLDPALFEPSTGRWLREVSPPRSAKPSPEEVQRAWNGLVTVSEAKDSGFVNLSVQHRSPVLAKQVVDWLITDINETLRAQDLAEAERAIGYLEEQLKATSVAEVRSLLAGLLRSHTEARMMATVDPAYVFAVIDPATLPEQKVAPKRALICVLGTLVGGFLGVLLSLIRRALRNRAEATASGAEA